MDKPTLRKHALKLSLWAHECISAILTKHNMGLIEAAREHGDAERLRALNAVLAELAAMYDKADQATPMHKGMRMALSSASDRVKALMQPNVEAQGPSPAR